MIWTMKQVGGRRRLRTRTKTARGSAGAAQSLRLGLRRPASLYIPKGTSFASQMEARAQSLLGAVFSGLLWATLRRPLSRPQAASVSLRLGHGAALTCHRHVIHYRAAAALPRRGAKMRRRFHIGATGQRCAAKVLKQAPIIPWHRARRDGTEAVPYEGGILSASFLFLSAPVSTLATPQAPPLRYLEGALPPQRLLLRRGRMEVLQ